MKYRKIEFFNHPILGNLSLDFCTSLGKVYDNIVFVGENGSGKTTILEFLDFINNSQYTSNQNFGFHIEVELSEQRHNELMNENGHPIVHSNKSLFIRRDIADINSGMRFFVHDDNLSVLSIAYTQKVSEVMKTIYSKTEANFISSQTPTVTTLGVDNVNVDNESWRSNLATNVKQLLINVATSDALDFQGMYFNNRHNNYTDRDIFKRMDRFSTAFKSIFDNTIMYSGVEDVQNPRYGQDKDVFFRKNGNKVSINQLSSGEKQIVFRGVYVLKDVGLLKDAPVLIDEPEISMHPKWQTKVVEFYRKLFVDSQNIQTTQLFYATHSTFVLGSTLNRSEFLIIRLYSDQNNVIKSEKISIPYILPSITDAETQHVIFGIYSNDYHNQLYCYLQDKFGAKSLIAADNHIKNSTFYNSQQHMKPSSYSGKHWGTLPTYIRNGIDHHAHTNTFTERELEISTELLKDICR